jgi:hypothetical protein
LRICCYITFVGTNFCTNTIANFNHRATFQFPNLEANNNSNSQTIKITNIAAYKTTIATTKFSTFTTTKWKTISSTL